MPFDIFTLDASITRSPLSSIENQATTGNNTELSSSFIENNVLQKQTNSSFSSNISNSLSNSKYQLNDAIEETDETNSSFSSNISDLLSNSKRQLNDAIEETDQTNSSFSSNISDSLSNSKRQLNDAIEETDQTNSSFSSNISDSLFNSKRKLNDDIEEFEGFSNIEVDELEEPPSKRSKKLFHRIHPLIQSELKLEWSLAHVHGIGLLNKDLTKKCLNICYMNSVIQCLANTAPFVQWLLNDENHGSCQLTRFDQFCSVCALRSIIMNIHPHIRNKSNLFCQLTEASAFQIARRITEVCSSFVLGQQEDPSEFLIFLLNHFMQCISSNDIKSFSTYLCNPLHSIFGINVKSSIICTNCQDQIIKKNYEIIWSIPIISYFNLKEALTAFCLKEKLTGDNSLQCSQCHRKTTALQSLQLANISPIIIIHLNRFIYDQNKKLTQKLKHFISYPEFINFMPYIISHNASQEDQENHQSDEYIYMLYAVLVHLGETANNGHIFVYVRSPDNLWYKINDESVTLINPKAVLSDTNSYLLWYTKLSEEKRNLYRKEIDELSKPSSRVSFSSTPIRRNVQTTRSFDNDSPISTDSTSDISNFDDPSPEKFLRKSSLMTHEPSPVTHEEDLIEYRTESRIEIIPKTNYKNQYPDYSSSPDTPRSSLSSELTPIPLTNKSNTSFRNDSSQLSDQATRPSRLSKISSTGSQSNVLDENSNGHEDFHIQLASSFNFKLQPVDLVKLKEIKTKQANKREARLYESMGLPIEIDKTTNKKQIFISKTTKTNTNNNSISTSYDSGEDIQKKESRINVEYLYILLPYIKKFNTYCGLCVRNCIFGKTTKNRNQLLRCYLYCCGKPLCTFNCSVVVLNNGEGYIIVNNATVRHAPGVKICRPIREPLRNLFKEKFKNGGSVYRIYQEEMQKRNIHEKNANNYDRVGKSRHTLRKIKSEAACALLLAPDVDNGLSKLFEKFKDEVNVQGKVKGAIQIVSKHPAKVIIFTETSIRLFDQLINQKNVTISWDATGSVIMETNNSPKYLYYELTMTLPGVVSEDGLIPISSMISSSHCLIDIIQWLEIFKHHYSQVFVGQQFPKPKFVLSDRAQIFLCAAIKFWNNEGMKDFLARAYRIVNGSATNEDLDLTNIHACVAHVLIDARRTINKFIIKEYRELGMWCVALLVNSCTWAEFKRNWQLICLVFLQLHLGEKHIKQEHQDLLLDRIRKIKSDSDMCTAVKSCDSFEDNNQSTVYDSYIYDFYDDEYDDDDDSGPNNTFSKRKKKKIVVDEEQEVNATDSKFKTVINKIFDDALIETGISKEDVLGINCRGILKWFKYLTRYFMPTAPIWSNMLLGDLSRHRRRTIRTYERFCVDQHEQRTTAISERRMGILKRVQLGGQIHMRLDVLLSIIIPDMLVLIDEYSNALMSYSVTTQIDSNNSLTLLDERRLKPIEERWKKTISKRGRGYYSKSPEQSAFTDLVSSLVLNRNDVNADLKLPNLSPNWLNVAIGLLLSTGYETEGYYEVSSSLLDDDRALIDVIKTFLEDWFSSILTQTNNYRSTFINFTLPTDELIDTCRQSTFILEKILIPLLPCNLIVNKIYSCNTCEKKMKIKTTITSIPINNHRSGLHLEHDINAFFGESPSDILCTFCNRLTIRQINILEFPSVLIIHINESSKNVKYRKPPDFISLNPFSDWRALGFPSSGIYTLVSFNSIIRSGANDLMVRVTKIKKSWSTSVNKRLIGEGDMLKRLYGHSRILLFQRVHNIKLNLFQAIIKCTMDTNISSFNNIPSCRTIQHVCALVETKPEFYELNNKLNANIRTYFCCNFCGGTPDSLSSWNHQIFLFKYNLNNQIIGYPVVSTNTNQNNTNWMCNHCNHSINNLELDIHQQVFLKCPSCLITCINPKIESNNPFDSHIFLRDIHDNEYNYGATALLCFSAYSDNIALIKKESNKYIQLIGDTFSEETSLTFNNLLDIFDTSASVLIFHHQINQPTNENIQIGKL